MRKFPAVLSVALLLAGCAMSATQFDATREALRGSPPLRQQAIADCTANQARRPLAERQDAARVMNVSVRAMPRTLCSRLVAGWSSGRLSYEDYRSAMVGAMTPNTVRIIQGR